MSGTASGRIPASQVVLIILGLVAIWLTFLYWPRRKEPPPPLAPVMAESRLRSVGLADNPDWEGLPDFFAVWADRIEWNDNKTYFAYWHPGAGAYAYFFEVVRQKDRFRFRTVSLQEVANSDYHAEDTDVAAVARREAEAPTHPFVFLSQLKTVPPIRPVTVDMPSGGSVRPMVPVDLKPPPVVVPPPAKATPP